MKTFRSLALLLAAACLALAALLPGPPGLPDKAQLSLGLLAAALTTWLSRALPYGVTSLLVIVLLYLLGVMPDLATAAAGLASDAILFLIGVNLMARAVARAGLVERVGRRVLALCNGLPSRPLWVMAAAAWILSPVTPSALLRLKAYFPIAQQLNSSFGFGERSNFLKGSLFVLAVLGPIASLSIMNGGSVSVVASRTIAEFQQPLSWIQWFVAMLVPTALTLAGGTFAVSRLFPPTAAAPGVPAAPRFRAAPANGDDPPAPAAAAEEPAGGPMAPHSQVVLIVTGVVLLLWILTDLPPAIPALIGAGLLALPGLAAIGREDVIHQNWEEILLVAGALSLSRALTGTGATAWVSSALLRHLDGGGTVLATLAAVIVFSLVMRLLFVVPSGAMAVVVPMMIDFGRTAGADPLRVALASTCLLGFVTWLPVHAPPSLVAFGTGQYGLWDHVRVSLSLAVLAVVLATFCFFVYWPALQAVGWL